ncbi:GHKL domain-containing protein [Candidatus Bathyarchaeota archaeon]|nr:GHKL domain-containing protein [Candidatus Bathyarchaeota archaeon]
MNANEDTRVAIKKPSRTTDEEIQALMNELVNSQRMLEKSKKLLKSRTDKLEWMLLEMRFFTRSISHDLKAPIRNIKGYLQLIFDQYKGKLDVKLKEYINKISSIVEKQDDLLDSLIYLSKLAHKEINARKFDISGAALTISDGLKARDPARKVTFTIQDDLTCKGDRDLLWLVLENLLDNAWKFTRKKQEAIIEVGSFQENGQDVFFVKDNGTGYNDKYANDLFVPFQRLHSSKDFEGSGIGLATVAHVIKMHRGEVWSESKEGFGSVFYFTIGARRGDQS